MTKTSLILAGGFLAAGMVAASATPLPPVRPDVADLTVKVQDLESGSSTTTVVKKHNMLGSKTTVTRTRSEPESTGVVIHRRERSSDCRHVTVHKEDDMGNSVTKHKTKC